MLQRTVRYAAVMFGASTVFSLLNFAASVTGMVGRSKEAYGEYATYVRIYAFAQGLLIFGANQTIQRFSAADPARRKDFVALALWGFLALLALCGAAGGALAAWVSTSVGLGVMAIPFVVVWWWSRYLIRTDLAGGREAFVTGMSSLMNTTLQVLFVTLTSWELALVYSDFLAVVIGGLVGISFFPGLAGESLPALLRRRIDRGLLKEAFRFGRPFWWAGQLFSVGDNASAALIRSLLGTTGMAASAAAQQLWQFVLKPMELLAQGALPALVSAKTQEERQQLYFQLLKLSLLVLPAVAIAAAAGMPLLFQVIDLIAALLGYVGEPFGHKYAEVPELIALLAVATPAMTFTMVWNQYSVAVGESKVSVPVQLASAVTVLVAITPLIAWNGLAGSYLAAVLAAFASMGAFVAVLGRKFPVEVGRGVRWTVGTTLFTGLALGSTRFWPPGPWSWISAGPAVLVYAVGAAIVGVFGKQELARVGGLVKKRLGR